MQGDGSLLIEKWREQHEEVKGGSKRLQKNPLGSQEYLAE